MNRKGKVLVIFGLLLMAAALFLTVKNMREEAAASEASNEALDAILPEVFPDQDANTVFPELPIKREQHTVRPAEGVYGPEAGDMPVISVNGRDYVALLSIPAISLELPVLNEWSYSDLKYAPCRFSGSAYTSDLVICGHNYAGHFRNLRELSPGDEVILVDMAGNAFYYSVMDMEILRPTAVEDMTTGDWDLTLFTCTVGARTRLALRCELQPDPQS